MRFPLQAAVTGRRHVSHPPAISESQRGAARAGGLPRAPFRLLVSALDAWRRDLWAQDGAPFRGVAAVVYAWRRRPWVGNSFGILHWRTLLWRSLSWLRWRARRLRSSNAFSSCGSFRYAPAPTF